MKRSKLNSRGIKFLSFFFPLCVVYKIGLNFSFLDVDAILWRESPREQLSSTVAGSIQSYTQVAAFIF